MAVSWTTLSNATVAAGAAVTTSLMTALRDNPEGIAQRASGAPKIFGVAYDYQEFTSSGTWTKPANAESGDKVIVYVVGAGGGGAFSGTTAGGGQGGGGLFMIFSDIDAFAASYSVVVGAGGAGAASVGSNGSNGGSSSFGTAGVATAGVAPIYLLAEGGQGGQSSGAAANTLGRVYFARSNNEGPAEGIDTIYRGGFGGGVNAVGGSSIFGGGGGGGQDNDNGSQGGISAHAGRGGQGTDTAGAVGGWEIDGSFPGGGGGGVDSGTSSSTRGGNGANGVVRVWCIKEA